MMSNYQVEDLIIEHDEKRIFGRIYLPDEAANGKRVPLVICAHGFGGNNESCEAYAREFAKRGYAAYCLDFCGAANSKSSGDTSEMTIFTEQADMEDSYTELAELGYVDLNNVFLFGMSMGGAVAALAAANKSNLIKGLILLYPAFSIPGDVRRAWPNRDEFPESFGIFNAEVGRAFIEAIYDFDFYEHITKYAGPVLILHGMSDDIVASGYSVRAVNIYPRADLELIGEVGHGFTGGAFKYAVRKIVGFLDEEADLPDESGLNGDLNFKGGGMFG